MFDQEESLRNSALYSEILAERSEIVDILLLRSFVHVVH